MYRMHEIYPERYRACRKCAGTGRIRCPKCKGAHTIIDKGAWHPMFNAPAWKYTDCSTCEGRGTIECPKCKGTGDEEKEPRLKASKAELTSKVVSPVPRNKPSSDEPFLPDLSYDELKDRFYALRKGALDSLDSQALGPYWRELIRGRLLNLEFFVFAGMQLYALTEMSERYRPTAAEQERLRELGLEPGQKDSGTYPDDDTQYRREFHAELEMLRIFYVAAARGIL
jgi:hypothetical protein